MRGARAKQIRRRVYDEADYREREYYLAGRQIVADPERRKYQRAKRRYVREGVLVPRLVSAVTQ